MSNIKENGLNSNALKVIAIAAMTIDHLAWLFLPGYSLDAVTLTMHIIGRLTAPIMIYFIVEGYYYAKNLKKYISRMFVFALILFPSRDIERSDIICYNNEGDVICLKHMK